MTSTRTGTGRRLKVSAHLGLGLVLAATLGLAGPTGATTRAAVDPACVAAGPSSARVGWGSLDGRDPNSVSAATARRIDERLRRATLVRPDSLRRAATRTGGGVITIPTHVHVIARSDGTGVVSRARLRAQVRAINRGFAGRTTAGAGRSPFRFRIASVDVTRNDAVYEFDRTRPGVIAAKKRLHRGGWGDLNLYVAGLQQGLLGYSSFPREVPLPQDGVVVLNETLPGGRAAPFNRGDTATHEIGHWLNLLHTFENGCRRPGDYVQDTPYQDDGANVFYCGDDPAYGNDTCRQPGRDPVHNFMSYGDDRCLNHFTRGQVRRMHHSWLALRTRR